MRRNNAEQPSPDLLSRSFSPKKPKANEAFTHSYVHNMIARSSISLRRWEKQPSTQSRTNGLHDLERIFSSHSQLPLLLRFIYRRHARKWRNVNIQLWENYEYSSGTICTTRFPRSRCDNARSTPPGISKGIKARESRRMNIDDGFVGRFRIREQVLSTIIALLAPLETY